MRISKQKYKKTRSDVVKSASSRARLSVRIGRFLGRKAAEPQDASTFDDGILDRQPIGAPGGSQTASVVRDGSQRQQTQDTPGGPRTALTIDRSGQDQQNQGASGSLWDRAYDSLAEQAPELVKDYEELLAKEIKMPGVCPF